MRILVYPHDLGMGGSQTNAIELAGEFGKLGADCTIFGRPGTLNRRIEELGLDFIESVDPGRRPSWKVVRQLRRLIDERGFEVLHGFEWPPTLEAVWAAGRRPGVLAVSTVMSMAVAPFIPAWVPLVVGTRQIAAAEKAAGRPRVWMLEPPVDLRLNAAPPEPELAEFRRRWGLGGRPLVVCVNRLAAQLKLEGLLTAIEVAGAARGADAFQLLIVGDGPSREQVRSAAELANASAGAGTVVLTGELLDPRPAYAVADVVVGMGLSALRALAFGKPLIVQGERGYFETLTPETVEAFRWQGWYGVGGASTEGPGRLRAALARLLGDQPERDALGRFGTEVVAEFSLERAAARQLAIYREELDRPPGSVERTGDAVRAGSRFLGYHLRRRLARWAGRGQADDFNADPVAGRPERPVRSFAARPGDPLVYFPGVSWDAVAGTDRHLATALAALRPVIWVDPPKPWRGPRPSPLVPTVSNPHPGITRLATVVPPGVTRPVSRDLAVRVVARAVLGYLRESRLTPSCVMISSIEPMLPALRGLPGRRIYFATDDFVEAAPLWGMSPAVLHRSREANLAEADLVLAVTPELAEELRRGPAPPIVFPNGCDGERYRDLEAVAPAPDVTLPPPIAGVIGQFNERTDLAVLEALARSGISLLLVGPRSFATTAAAAHFERLRLLPGVQWIDRVPLERLPGYYRAVTVGLTPYADTRFNRRSFPLKTVEYLAAGLPVVSSAAVLPFGLDQRFVTGADTPESFVSAVRTALATQVDRAVVRAGIEGHGWPDRAAWLQRLIVG